MYLRSLSSLFFPLDLLVIFTKEGYYCFDKRRTLVLDPPEINYENSRFQKPRVGSIGDVISVGTQLTTGKGSKVILLFTNVHFYNGPRNHALY